MVKKIEFKNVRDKFQAKLKENVSEIKPQTFTKCQQIHTEKLLKENITAVYKKAPTKLEKLINLEAKSITKKLKLPDRIEYFPQSSAYITLKDNKENFM